MQLKKGDPCRVRLHTGEVVEAVYCEPDRDLNKSHWVDLGDRNLAIAWSAKPGAGDEILFPVVRFVGNPCALVPVGVSV